MAPAGSCFEMLNTPTTASLPPHLDYFTLTARPATKIWREPGLPDTITAPLVFTALREPLIVAEVTIMANWEMEGDQAGLVIFGGAPPGANEHHPQSRSQPPVRRWATAGLEFTSQQLNVSCAATISPFGADVSLTPLTTAPPVTIASEPRSIGIKFERVGDALWVLYKHTHTSHWPSSRSAAEAGEEWHKVREIAGFFWGIDAKNGVWIGCYASRPWRWPPTTMVRGRREDEADGLWVEFEDFEVL